MRMSQVVIVVLALAGMMATKSWSADGPATQPATAPAGGQVPNVVVGNWVEGSVSPTTFWETQTGKFAGNARGMAQYLTLNADGTYKQYVYIETRSYNITTQVWTQHEGTVTFNGNSFTLKPTKGHYKSAGSWKIDRDMTEKELAEKTVTYKWRKEKDPNGAEMLVIPFDDGSAFRLKRAS